MQLCIAAKLPWKNYSVVSFFTVRKFSESESKQCPGARCHQTGVSPDSLVPNMKMRQAVDNFRNERGMALSTGDVGQPKVAVPNELKCPLCDDLLRNTVLAVCCGDSFCDDCIRLRLIGTGFCSLLKFHFKSPTVVFVSLHVLLLYLLFNTGVFLSICALLRSYPGKISSVVSFFGRFLLCASFQDRNRNNVLVRVAIKRA
jgi:hypothetical protein